MRRILVSSLALVMLMFAVPGTVSAHELEQNNGVSVVVHIPPFDAPEANTPQTLEFELGSTATAFSLTNYRLTLIVSEESKTIVSEPAAPAFFGSATKAKAMVTFPKIGVYDVALQGKSVTPGKPDFAVSYSVRVASSKTATMPNDGSEALWVGGTIFICFLMFTAARIIDGGRYSKKKAHK
jgi:hypothetical protein